MPEPKNAAFAAYVPALHRGYMELFARYPYVQTFYIFGQSILDQEDYLRKDLRALDPTQQRTVIGGLKRFKHIEIIEKKDLATIAKKHELLILPDEDISHRIADLAPGGQYEFSPIFFCGGTVDRVLSGSLSELIELYLRPILITMSLNVLKKLAEKARTSGGA